MLPDVFDGIEGLKIGLCLTQGDYVLDPEVERNTLDAAAALEAAGATVEQFDLAVTEEEINRAAAVHFDKIFGDWIGMEAAAAPEDVTAYAAEFARS